MKHKSAVVGFTYLFSLICASFITSDFNFILGIVFIFISIPILFIRNKKFLLFTLTAGCGFLVYGAYAHFNVNPILETDGEIQQISGRIIAKTTPYRDNASYTIKTEINKKPAKVIIYTSDLDAVVGDMVEVLAVFKRLTNNANFSEYSYYQSKGILLSSSNVSDISKIDGSFDLFSVVYNYISNYNNFIKEKIIISLPNDYGALLCGVFLGDKSFMTDELYDNMRYTGLAHFTAVSGAHLSVIANIFLAVLNMIGFRNKRKTRFIILLVIILYFVIFFNLSISVVRSGIMLITFYGADLFFRKQNGFNSIGVALIFILAFQPYACRDIGLLLSIAGCFGVGVAAPVIASKIKGNNFLGLKNDLITVICADLCALPLSAIFFGGFSTVSFIVNLIIQPFSVILLFTMLMYTFSIGLVPVFLLFSAISSKIIVYITNFFASFKYSYISLDYDFLLFTAILIFVFIFVIHSLLKNISASINAGIVSITVLVGLITSYNLMLADKTMVRVYSDGSSGAVIIRQKEICLVIATDDSRNVIRFINNYIKSNSIDETGVLCLINSTHNSLPIFEKIPHNTLITPNEIVGYQINEKIVIEKNEENLFLYIDDVIISISKINLASNIVDINILYGGGKLPKLNLDMMVFIRKNQTLSSNNEYNAYYEKVVFYL